MHSFRTRTVSKIFFLRWCTKSVAIIENDNTQIFDLFICSYAEVRAERRRELGIEESLPEIAADKVSFPLPSYMHLSHIYLKLACILRLQA